MPLLYSRDEDVDQIVIKYKYWPLFYFTLIPAFIWALGPWEVPFYADVIVGVAIVFFLVLFSFGHANANKEIRKAMKAGIVEITGSKFSFKKPLTFMISKTARKEEQD
jgi:hypothetical protein